MSSHGAEETGASVIDLTKNLHFFNLLEIYGPMVSFDHPCEWFSCRTNYFSYWRIRPDIHVSSTCGSILCTVYHSSIANSYFLPGQKGQEKRLLVMYGEMTWPGHWADVSYRVKIGI